MSVGTLFNPPTDNRRNNARNSLPEKADRRPFAIYPAVGKEFTVTFAIVALSGFLARRQFASLVWPTARQTLALSAGVVGRLARAR